MTEDSALIEAIARAMAGGNRWERFPADRDAHWIPLAQKALSAFRTFTQDDGK